MAKNHNLFISQPESEVSSTPDEVFSFIPEEHTAEAPAFDDNDTPARVQLLKELSREAHEAAAEATQEGDASISPEIKTSQEIDKTLEELTSRLYETYRLAESGAKQQVELLAQCSGRTKALREVIASRQFADKDQIINEIQSISRIVEDIRSVKVNDEHLRFDAGKAIDDFNKKPFDKSQVDVLKLEVIDATFEKIAAAVDEMRRGMSNDTQLISQLDEISRMQRTDEVVERLTSVINALEQQGGRFSQMPGGKLVATLGEAVGQLQN